MVFTTLVLLRSYVCYPTCCEIQWLTAKSFLEESTSHYSPSLLLFFYSFCSFWDIPWALEWVICMSHLWLRIQWSFLLSTLTSYLSSFFWSPQEEAVSLIKVLCKCGYAECNWALLRDLGKALPSSSHTIARCWGRLEDKSQARTRKRATSQPTPCHSWPWAEARGKAAREKGSRRNI